MESRDQWSLMQAQPQAMAEVEPERFHLARKTDLLRLRKRPRDLVRADSRLEQIDRPVHPFARLAVRRTLRGRGASNVEGAVVTGAIAHEGLNDVEECLIAGADQAIGEVMRMRRAALAGNRVDRFDTVGAHRVESAGG